MTTTETTRPLPTTLEVLRAHWLPVEPETAVSKAMAGIRRIDSEISVMSAKLSAANEYSETVAAELVDQAVEGGDLAAVLAGYRPGHVDLEQRVELLQRARLVAGRRYDQAQRGDEQYTAWRDECTAIVNEWQSVMSGDAERRVTRLVDFAARH